MDEALQRVRLDMGPDAVILQARQLPTRSWWGFRGSAVEVTAGVPAAESGRVAPARRSTQSLEREVADLKWLVERMVSGEAGERRERATPALGELRGGLRSQGLPEALIAKLLDCAVAESGGDRQNAGRLRESLVAIMARMIPTSGPARICPGRATRIALVGPTGVGKTTTIAKLAAHFALRERRNVGFLAADTFRIGAVEQLKRYAELMSAPVRVARTAEDVARAASALSSCDLVFIDTAGRSHRDVERMEELRGYLRAARADEVQLALSATADTASLFKAVDRFTPLGVNRLILTKLDEAERAGVILQTSARAGIPISHVTTGQGVPDDIVVADSRALARSILEGPAVLLERRSLRADAPMRRSA
jgi:flagellar biosynthesis protein FlhF